jgi:hypothetical protein
MDNYTLVRIFLIILAVATLVVLIMRYNNKSGYLDSEGFYETDDEFLRLQEAILPKSTQPNMRESVATEAQMQQMTSNFVPTATPSSMMRGAQIATTTATPTASASVAQPYLENEQTADYKAVNYTDSSSDADDQKLPNDCFPKDKLTADDLLPKDAANTKWSQVNPAGQGSVKDQNFLQAGYHVGLNTTQGTMKNANLQLRSDPPAPKTLVSPWLNSSYEPDMMRKPLEIGDSC